MKKQVEFLFSNNKIIGIRVLDKVYDLPELDPNNREKLYQEMKKITVQVPDLLYLIKNQNQQQKQQAIERRKQKEEEKRKNLEWHAKLAKIKKQEEKRNKTLPFKISYKDMDPNQPDEITIIDGNNEIKYKKEENKNYLEFVEFVADTYPQIKEEIDIESLKKQDSLSSKIKNFHIFQSGKEIFKKYKNQVIGAALVGGTFALATIGYMIGIHSNGSNNEEESEQSKVYQADNQENMNKVNGIEENHENEFEMMFDESIFQNSNKTTVITADPEETRTIIKEESSFPTEKFPEQNNSFNYNESWSSEPSIPESSSPDISSPPNQSIPNDSESSAPEPILPTDPDNNQNGSLEDNNSQWTAEDEYHKQQNYENIYQDVYSYAYSLFISEFKNSGGMGPEINKVIDAVHQQYGNFYDDAINEAYQNFKEQYMFNGISIGKTQ